MFLKLDMFAKPLRKLFLGFQKHLDLLVRKRNFGKLTRSVFISKARSKCKTVQLKYLTNLDRGCVVGLVLVPCAIPCEGEGGVGSHMNQAGMLVGNCELQPWRRLYLGVVQGFCDP